MKKLNHLILLLTSFYLGGAEISYAETNANVEHFTIKRFYDSYNDANKQLNDSYIDVYLKHPKHPEHAKGKVGILLMLQGTGCLPSRDRLLGWEEQWNERGKNKVAVLVTEKIGVKSDGSREACTTEYRQNHTFQQRVYDYSRVLQHLRNTATWWNHKLYILGGSEGGGLAAILAALIPETEKIVMLVAGGAMTRAEALPAGVEISMQNTGASQDEIDKMKQQFESLFIEIRKNPTPDKLLGSDPELGSVFQETYKFLGSALDMRPLNVLVDLTIPIYMAHGTEDINDPVESARTTVKAFNELGKENLVYREYEGLDHGFKDRDGVSSFGEVVTEAFDWLFASLELDDQDDSEEHDEDE